MKISGPGTVSSSAVRRKGSGGSGGSRPFSVELTALAGHASGAGSARHIDPVSSLLSLQEVSDPDDERRRGTAHGQEVLDHLERIRLGLLAGRISRQGLDDLLGALRARRAAVSDPGLRGILEEIELRAAVELAKLKRTG